ncbi:hypothetical protein C8J56DRAFT_775540 [Mycena floridula]|nr:hypothetical protein C8J56DRAFT_775540 [Mycena floridula]
MEWAVHHLFSHFVHRINVVHSTTHPIVDSAGRTIGLLAGFPSGNHAHTVAEAKRAFHQVSNDLHFSAAHRHHRQGDYETHGMGISFSGGQMIPGNISNTDNNKDVLDNLKENWAIRRLAQWTDQMVESYFPSFHNLYHNILDVVVENDTGLIRNFDDACFAGAHINCGRHTVTALHCDYKNFGICPVISLGDFNPDNGGHLVLWDLGLVIRFPPGALIILPSALVKHSNTPVADQETRISFAQFTASGLVRWVHNGMRSDVDFLASAPATEKAAWNNYKKSGEFVRESLALWTSYNGPFI